MFAPFWALHVIVTVVKCRVVKICQQFEVGKTNRKFVSKHCVILYGKQNLNFKDTYMHVEFGETNTYA